MFLHLIHFPPTHSLPNDSSSLDFFQHQYKAPWSIFCLHTALEQMLFLSSKIAYFVCSPFCNPLSLTTYLSPFQFGNGRFYFYQQTCKLGHEWHSLNICHSQLATEPFLHRNFHYFWLSMPEAGSVFCKVYFHFCQRRLILSFRDCMQGKNRISRPCILSKCDSKLWKSDMIQATILFTEETIMVTSHITSQLYHDLLP